MALETKEFVVNGVRYRTTVLDAVTGRKLYLRILKAAAPGLEVLALAKSDVQSAMLSMIADVLGGLEVQLFDDLCDALGNSTVVCSGDKQVKLTSEVFGLHFAGKYKDMTDWLVEALNANKFLDFLSAISGPANGGPAKA